MQALLEALIERIGPSRSRFPRRRAGGRSARPRRLNRFFSALAAGRTARQTVILALLRVWHADEMPWSARRPRWSVVPRSGPLLHSNVRRACRGHMNVPVPGSQGEMVMSFSAGPFGPRGRRVCSRVVPRTRPSELPSMSPTWHWSLERISGRRKVSVHLVDIWTRWRRGLFPRRPSTRRRWSDGHGYVAPLQLKQAQKTMWSPSITARWQPFWSPIPRRWRGPTGRCRHRRFLMWRPPMGTSPLHSRHGLRDGDRLPFQPPDDHLGRDRCAAQGRHRLRGANTEHMPSPTVRIDCSA